MRPAEPRLLFRTPSASPFDIQAAAHELDAGVAIQRPAHEVAPAPERTLQDAANAFRREALADSR